MTFASSAVIFDRGTKSPVRSPPGCLRSDGGVCVTMISLLSVSSSISPSSDSSSDLTHNRMLHLIQKPDPDAGNSHAVSYPVLTDASFQHIKHLAVGTK